MRLEPRKSLEKLGEKGEDLLSIANTTSKVLRASYTGFPY